MATGARNGESVHAGAKLYALRDGFLYLGTRAFSGPTKRQPLVLLLSLSGASFSLRAGGAEIDAAAALVAPRVVRSFTLSGDGVASVNIEPSHPLYPGLVRKLRTPALALPIGEFSSIISVLASTDETALPNSLVSSLFEQAVTIVSALMGGFDGNRDLRVEALVDLLRDHDSVDFDYVWCRHHLALSPSRVSHLFSEEIGLPMRSFVAWLKTKEALCRLSSTRSITRVAHEAGFADSAHLSRTLKKTIGILPSRIGLSRQIQFVDLRTL